MDPKTFIRKKMVEELWLTSYKNIKALDLEVSEMFKYCRVYFYLFDFCIKLTTVL